MSKFSSTNVYRNTTAADYLNQLRLQQQSDLVGNTSQTNFTPLYIITESDTINITDAVSNNANTQSQADSMTITDSVVNLALNSGTFQFDGDFFCGHGYVPANWYGTGKTAGDFDDSAPGGFNEPTNPLRFSFGDLG